MWRAQKCSWIKLPGITSETLLQSKMFFFFFGISSFMSFYSVTTDNKTWGKNHLLECMSLFLLLYFGPSTVFLENSKIFGWQLFKHLRPQSSAITTFSIFFFYSQNHDVIQNFFLFLFFFFYKNICRYNCTHYYSSLEWEWQQCILAITGFPH